MSDSPAILIDSVSHKYGERLALDQLSFQVQPGEIFGLLGPNGGGKTTLFKLLTTLMPVQSGQLSILGFDVAKHADEVRQSIGVTFQSPSVDVKLTVRENIVYQGRLYGLSGADLRKRVAAQMERFQISDRANDLVQTLSGGLKRRVEIAKSLLHNPRVLLLDEPSTGLDPGARFDLWQALQTLRAESGVTVLVTTHMMEEAEKCDRLVILDRGKLAAIGTPDELRSKIGGDCITIQAFDSSRAASLSQKITSALHITPQLFETQLRIEAPEGAELVHRLTKEFSSEIRSITLGKPTLEDVFIRATGHRFWDEGKS
ncbi:MAG: ATP-binding cassette domain-containing protein [Planctomycetaceae bacterium]